MLKSYPDKRLLPQSRKATRTMTDIKEKAIRNETICRGCDNPKSKGLVVCWNCFKYRKDVTPFKYFDGSLEEWLREVHKLPPVRFGVN